MEAMFCTEERYAALTIYFDSTAQKKTICDTMDELLPRYDLSPEIAIKPVGKERRGELTVEFHDDYNRDAEPLVEELTRRLSLTFVPCAL